MTMSTSTSGLSPEQLEQRRHLITATDAAAICGVSPWKTPHDVYAEKVGAVSPRAPNFRMRRGLALEELGLDWLRETRAPLVVQSSSSKTLTHPILTWLGATPDALIYEPPAGQKPIAVGEVKTAGLRAAAGWTDDDGEMIVPEQYLIQVCVQIAVVAVPKAYITAMLDTEEEPRVYEIERDPELETAVLEACDTFRRKHLEPRVPPPMDGSDGAARMIRALFPRQTRDMLLSTPSIEDLASKYRAAHEAEAIAKAEKEKLQALLCAHIGEHEGLSGAGWRALWTHREAAEIKAYTRKAYRHFDLRWVKAKRKAA